MIEAMGITLRESVEAILVIFIMAAYLKRTGEGGKTRYVYGGAIAAVLLSIVLAWGLSAVGMNPENEMVEAVLYLIAGVLVLSLTIWMLQHGKHFKSEVESHLEKSTSVFALVGIAFFMVFREGVETVIFLQSLLLSGSSPIENFTGGLAGIILAVLFAVVFLRGTIRIDLGRFFRITGGVLLVLALNLFGHGFHELFELQILPAWGALEAFTDILASDAVTTGLIALMLVAMAGSILYDLITASPPEFGELAENKRKEAVARFRQQKVRKISMATFVTVAIVGVLIGTAI